MSFFFRWKGENVATTEVAEVIEMLDLVEEANVYGIVITGEEWLHKNRFNLIILLIVAVRSYESSTGVCPNNFRQQRSTASRSTTVNSDSLIPSSGAGCVRGFHILSSPHAFPLGASISAHIPKMYALIN